MSTNNCIFLYWILSIFNVTNYYLDLFYYVLCQPCLILKKGEVQFCAGFSQKKKKKMKKQKKRKFGVYEIF